MIHIYFSNISEEKHIDLVENELVKFPIDFQNKIKKYRRWQDAQLSLLGRMLLLKGINQIYNQDYLSKEIQYTKYNKPYFKDDLIQFNISHSGDIVVCAFSDKSEIGIDIEMISDIEINDFKSQLTESEMNKILSSNNKNGSFFEYWTQKEAVIKAHGHGLTIPLKSFEILENETAINNKKFYLKEIKINNQYKCFLSSKEYFSEITTKQIQIN